MAKRLTRRAGAVFGIGLATFMLAFPGLVAATTNEPIASTGGMTATFPLLGTNLKVDVTLTDVGDISGVTLDPAGTLPQTASDTHMVKFSNVDGTAKVSIRTGGSSLSIRARSTLTSLTGTASWAADVFGSGTKSTVVYTVGADSTGKPTLAIGAVSTPSGVTSAVVAPVSRTSSDKSKKSKGEGSRVFGGVTFTSGGYTKHLTITVLAKADGSATLGITLSGRDKLKLTGTVAALAGARTWTAHLCDGTKVSVAYHVAADGSVVFDSATPSTFKEKAFDASKSWFWHSKDSKAKSTVKGFLLRFDTSRVGVAAFLKAKDDGTFALVVQGSSGHCGGGFKINHDKSHHHGGNTGSDNDKADRKGGQDGGPQHG